MMIVVDIRLHGRICNVYQYSSLADADAARDKLNAEYKEKGNYPECHAQSFYPGPDNHMYLHCG